MNMAPGLNREFLSQNWENMINRKLWYELIDEAREEVDEDVKPDIQAYDIDEAVLKAARENATNAGVSIHIQKRDVSELTHAKKYGFIITNPPYGERLEDKESLPPLYKTLGERFKALDNWSLYMITSYEDCEKYIGRKANKNRKVYNGMIKTYFYQFEGDKPPKAKSYT